MNYNGGVSCMTPEQVKEVSDSGLVSIQSHTTTHPALAYMNTEQQAEQTPEAPGLLEGERIDLNTATLSDLTRLPGIGEKKGQAILDKRTELGGFQSVDQLLEVRGIGEGILARISPYVTVTP